MKCRNCGYPEVETTKSELIYINDSPIGDTLVTIWCPNCKTIDEYISEQEPSKYPDGKP